MPEHPLSSRVHPASPKAIQQAADILAQGDLVALPTETVYGLAADATQEAAVKKIYAAKGRPSHNPLIIHVSSLDMAQQYAKFTPQALTLAKAFWPGPFTMVLERHADQNLAPTATAGLDTVAIRFPAHPIAQQVLNALGRPLAAPSANPSGTISPSRVEHVEATLSQSVRFILDDGATTEGLESTIVAAYDTTCRILRPGTITPDDVSRVLDSPIDVALGETTIEAPGMLKKHYAPKTPVRLNVTNPAPNDGYLAFGPAPSGFEGPLISLSEREDLKEAAENLFDALHRLDQENIRAIAIAPIPLEGIGLAINDRLSRAAAT